jgi:transcriptional regulator with XRE-family HTH domain
MSVMPCSVRRMTKHDHWCKSTSRGVEGRLRFLRLQGGLAQAQLANALVTTRSAIARGLRRTSLDAINRVATEIKHEAAMLIEPEGIA